jgi:hypothetical protein
VAVANEPAAPTGLPGALALPESAWPHAAINETRMAVPVEARPRDAARIRGDVHLAFSSIMTSPLDVLPSGKLQSSGL